MVKRLLVCVRQNDTVARLGDQSHSLTTGVAIAIYVGLERSASDLFKCADAATYRAKSLGRNTACIKGH